MLVSQRSLLVMPTRQRVVFKAVGLWTVLRRRRESPGCWEIPEATPKQWEEQPELAKEAKEG